MSETPEKKKDLAYYLTLFKIEGHSTFRAHLSADPDGFEKQTLNDKAKVTESNTMRIDRVTGTFTLPKTT